MNIFVTQKIPPAGFDFLKTNIGRFDANLTSKVLPKTELKKRIRGRDGILSLLTDIIDEEALEAAGPRLKVVSNLAVGFDNIDVRAATRRKILVCNTPGVLTKTTAEMAWALLFAAARNVAESDRWARAGKFKKWDPQLFLGQNVSGKTLGVVGTGRIGTEFALMSKGFGMRVLYFNRSKNETLEKSLGARKTGLNNLLKESDFVSLHVNLNPETRHLIGSKELNQMKPTSVLINTSRGPVVDEKALVRALKQKKIFAAGLDVYENEPKFAAGLKSCSNAVLATHIASATSETRNNMSLLAAQNLVSALKTGRPAHCVNPEVMTS